MLTEHNSYISVLDKHLIAIEMLFKSEISLYILKYIGLRMKDTSKDLKTQSCSNILESDT